MELKDLSKGKVYWILKAVVLFLSIGIIFAGISLILGAGLSLQQFVLRIYLFLFAIKIFICELRCAPFLRLFPYMDNFVGKGLFLIFVGVLMVSITNAFDLSRIIGIVLVGCGIGFIILRSIGYTVEGDKGKKMKKKKKKEGNQQSS